jgi:hypothetical protein
VEDAFVEEGQGSAVPSVAGHESVKGKAEQLFGCQQVLAIESAQKVVKRKRATGSRQSHVPGQWLCTRLRRPYAMAV